MIMMKILWSLQGGGRRPVPPEEVHKQRALLRWTCLRWHPELRWCWWWWLWWWCRCDGGDDSGDGGDDGYVEEEDMSLFLLVTGSCLPVFGKKEGEVSLVNIYSWSLSSVIDSLLYSYSLSLSSVSDNSISFIIVIFFFCIWYFDIFFRY